YLAFSFAAAFRTEPVLTHIRDQLGPAHLRIFQGDALQIQASRAAGERFARRSTLHPDAAQSLSRVAKLSLDAMEQLQLPLLHGSNAWAVAGRRTASGKPLLAGDPHISYGLPSTWYEAHLQAPGFELYGHHLALMPFALLGHNTQFGWSLTMFQNDDVDFVAEKVDPHHPNQVWHQGRWVALQERNETLAVKGQAPVSISIRHSPHGPLITDVFRPVLAPQAVALWWTFLESDNPLLPAFYSLNRAASLPAARAAVRQIHAPGLNVVWASAAGDIAWWAAARLPLRPAGIDPGFVLDAARGEAVKTGFAPFSENPQLENPAQGHIVSANQQPTGPLPPAGYYNLPQRARRIEAALQDPHRRWRMQDAQALQQDTSSDYGPSLLKHMLPAVQARTSRDAALLQQLKAWDGRHDIGGSSATVFTQWLYELARASLLDELGPTHFDNLLKTRAIDHALPRLLADAASPWWDDRQTSAVETREDIVRKAWQSALDHLTGLYGPEPARWSWGSAHTVSHGHPLGRQKPLDRVFDVGPFEVPGGRETVNNFSHPLGPAPWKVSYGPSTRRVIDFAAPGQALGINPVGQSGVLFDRHHHDQAEAFHQGRYVPQHLLQADVQAHARSQLTLKPLQ
ncbi:MAG: penicillin acylase family protein, partial [Betaproteobacteria bacterium]